MVTRDQNPELNLRTFSNVGPSWPDVHKVRLTACLSLYLVLISFHLILNLKEATKEFTNFLIFCKIQIDD